MKLYREEQVKDMLGGFIGSGHVDAFLKRYYTPIELPSNDEIEKWAHSKYHEVGDSRWFEPLQVGAIWMRDKLTNTKEK